MKRILQRCGKFQGMILALFLLSLSPTLGAQDLTKMAWGMNAHYGVDAAKAWSLAKKTNGDCSKSNVVVAVIDTGLDIHHPALQNSLWTNEKKLKSKGGIHNDSDGYKDDLHGYDFARKTGDLIDTHGHGTHIAGIIAANAKGASTFKGVCPGVKIMALRYYNEKASGEENLKNTIRAIDYAIDHEATIINYSGGGALASTPEFLALKRAQDKGILVVAAAGNEKKDADLTYYYPAAYNLSNILSVTAINKEGFILPSSNWGVVKVHVAAPGNDILSTLPGNSYGTMTGTSQATAFATGVAALIMSENPGISIDKVRSIIESSAIKSEKLARKARSSAYVNAPNALQMAMSGTNAASHVAAHSSREGKKLAGQFSN